MENNFIKWLWCWRWKWFFALDITNLEDPKQIFSIKNDPINKIITHWDSDRWLMIFLTQWNY